MSMELIAIVAMENVTSTDTLNKEAEELSVPVIFETNIELLKHQGYLPALIGGNESGVEVYVSSFGEIENLLPSMNEIGVSNPVVLTFRWGGDFLEGATAMYAAAVLTTNGNGVAFDTASGTYIQSDQLLQGAQIMLNYQP